MRTADLWRPENTCVRCLLCPHHCLIAVGRTGVCGVRRNDGGTLVATTYACVSSAAVDPIEKKPVFHYHPGSTVFSVGSVGCTMSCGHCQNWRISREKSVGYGVRMEAIAPDDAVQRALDSGCAGIAFTYNEPVIWAEYVHDVARIAKASGLYTVMVTNGYITSDGLDYLGPHIDVWRVDIKGASDATYRALCKVPSGDPVLDMAVHAQEAWSMHVEVVTNVVPTINDSVTELRAIARFVARSLGTATPWHVTRFIPCLEFAHLERTPVETLMRAAEIGAEEGLDYIYIGNVLETGVGDTVCPACGARAIVRDGYTIIRRATRAGVCVSCGRNLGIVE